MAQNGETSISAPVGESSDPNAVHLTDVFVIFEWVFPDEDGDSVQAILNTATGTITPLAPVPADCVAESVRTRIWLDLDDGYLFEHALPPEPGVGQDYNAFLKGGAWQVIQEHLDEIGSALWMKGFAGAGTSATVERYCVFVHGGGNLDNGPTAAIFEVDERMAKDLVRYEQLLKVHKLDRIEQSGYLVAFLQWNPFTDPDDADDAGERNRVSTDCDSLVVSQDKFYFKAYVKDTDIMVQSKGEPIEDLARHFGIPFGSTCDLSTIKATVSQALPGTSGYEKGFADAIESLALALLPKTSESVLFEGIQSTLDAYQNNVGFGEATEADPEHVGA